MSRTREPAWRGYLIDHHSPAPPVVTLDRLDIEEYRRFVRIANITTLMMYCKDHWGYSYYDTSVGTRHPGLTRDWVEAVSGMLREEGVEFNAYYCLEYDTLAPLQHPQWSIVDAAGDPVRLEGRMAKWGMPCYETAYRSYVLGQLEEIVDRYRPDSLFLDIFGKTLCYCDACRAGFRADFGYELPVAAGSNVNEYQTFDFGEQGRDVNAFLERCAERMLDEIMTTVKRIDPTLQVTINFAALYPKSIRDRLDYQFTEPWAGNWLSAGYSRDTAGGQLPQLGPGDVSEVYNYRPHDVYRLAAAQIAAAGCRVFFYSGSQHTDGTLEHEEARRIGRAYEDIQAIEPWLSDREVFADVAIIQSDSSVTARAGSHVVANAIGRCKKPDPHRRAVLGAMQCCDEASIAWTVLPEQEADAKTLRRYRLVILAGLYCIGEPLASALRDYLHDGGALIADGECGLYARDGSRLTDFVTSDLLGCSFRSRLDEYEAAEWGGYVAPLRGGSSAASSGDGPGVDPTEFWAATPDTFVPAGRVQYRVSPAPGAQTLGHLVPPAVALTDATWVNWWCPPPRADKVADSGVGASGVVAQSAGLNPAVVASRYGRGRAIYLAWDFFHAKADGLHLTQGIFAGAASRLLPDPSIALETSYPVTVSLSAYVRGDELIVHVISHLAERTNGDAPPVEPGVLRLNATIFPATSAHLVAGDSETGAGGVPLSVARRERSFEVVLPAVRIYGLVVVKLDGLPRR